MTGDTICARASGAGKAGVAVWRVSGPEAFAVASKLMDGRPPKGRRAALRNLVDADGGLIDRGLVIFFKGPCSFTGEDVAELHVHGSRAVERALADALFAAGAREAEAGEFTRRALRNGKLDLAQVEALADLIDADTEAQRRQALGQLDGRLSALAEGWRARLVAILAPLEADIDFPDEEGVPAAVAARAGPQIEAMLAELRRRREESNRIRTIREGVRVAILGAPNAGKSTLLNRLAGSDLAIVSALPGTTRDVIEARLDLGGLPVLLADTAGLRTAGDEIEAEGVRRSRARAESADLRLFVVDVAAYAEQSPTAIGGDLMRPGDFVVLNKIDAAGSGSAALSGSPPGAPFSRGGILASRTPSIPPHEKGGPGGDRHGKDEPDSIQQFRLSAKTGEGVDAFIAALAETIRERFSASAETGLSRRRHVEAVDRAIASLERAQGLIATAPELAAEDVRLAARALGEITGAVDVEDVLAEIFASFCIGK
jgi:tRNA modification GTPase